MEKKWFSLVTQQFFLRITMIVCGFIFAFNGHLFAQNDTDIEEYTYPPLFTEGKSWTMWHGCYLYNPYTDEESATTDAWIDATADGVKTIEGRECVGLKLNVDFENREMSIYYDCPICSRLEMLPEYIYAYENDGEVYIYRNPGPYFEELMDDYLLPEALYGEPYFDKYFDFNLNQGDIIYYSRGDSSPNVDIEYKQYGKRIRRVINHEDEAYLFGNRREWIEGIGSNGNSFLWEPYWYLVQPVSQQMETFCLATCRENGELIFDYRQNMINHGISIPGFSINTGVNNLSERLPESESPYLNLQGIPVNNPVKGEIYINAGKKSVFYGN